MRNLTAEDVRSKLLTLDDARARLATTEPLSRITFTPSDSSKVKFRLPPAWNAGLDTMAGDQVTDARATVNGTEYNLTKDAILGATSLIGLTRQYVGKTPGDLVAPHLDYWYHNGSPNTELQLLAQGHTAFGFTKASIIPFSNLRLLDAATDKMRERYGANAEILVDFKFHHDLRKTYVRLIVPDSVRQISSARPNDPWSVGIQFINSLMGDVPLSLKGYLFAWTCANGNTTFHVQSGNYNRRQLGQGDEVFEWARNAVDEILGGLESELDAVQALTQQGLDGEVNDVLAHIFTEFKVPLAARETIIAEMVDSDDLTVYGVMQAITSAANADLTSPEGTDNLLGIGGAIPHALGHRCGACHQFMSD